MANIPPHLLFKSFLYKMRINLVDSIESAPTNGSTKQHVTRDRVKLKNLAYETVKIFSEFITFPEMHPPLSYYLEHL